ncbi:MAG: CYTH domain-containing protein [Candidatus Doudnabacteria bacterium]|nr:CYTH domain-containing protein [Candidatus Doudnabacteria bacterium]
MNKEIETKVLNIDKSEITNKLTTLGATKVLETKLTVDWFRPTEVTDDNDPWYLRIRTTSDGKSEITWKSKPEFIGISKQVTEINIPTNDPESMADLFKAIGLVIYGHQEKYRTSWKYEDWRFDLDEYPNIPAYLEIEGHDEQHLQQAITLLGLEQNKSVAEGERTLIQKEYGQNWHDMRFTE